MCYNKSVIFRKTLFFGLFVFLTGISLVFAQGNNQLTKSPLNLWSSLLSLVSEIFRPPVFIPPPVPLVFPPNPNNPPPAGMMDKKTIETIIEGFKKRLKMEEDEKIKKVAEKMRISEEEARVAVNQCIENYKIERERCSCVAGENEKEVALLEKICLNYEKYGDIRAKDCRNNIRLLFEEANACFLEASKARKKCLGDLGYYD